MRQVFFSIHLRRYTQLTFFFLCVYFAFLTGAAAKDRCPSSKDHSLSAVKLQLYTAYQTAYDGYHTPCDLQCMGKSLCVENCQTKKGLQSLGLKFDQLLMSKNLKSCESYTHICLEQCSQHGSSCDTACGKS